MENQQVTKISSTFEMIKRSHKMEEGYENLVKFFNYEFLSETYALDDGIELLEMECEYLKLCRKEISYSLSIINQGKKKIDKMKMKIKDQFEQY